MDRRARRFWSVEEKRQICAETRVPGVSVSAVARRHDVNTNLLFTWLRDQRFSPREPIEDGACFLPVTIEPERDGLVASPDGGGRIEIDLAGGLQLRVIGGYEPEVLARLVRGLKS